MSVITTPRYDKNVKKYYHGSNNDFDEFNSDGVWITDDKQYAMNHGNILYEVDPDFGNMAISEGFYGDDEPTKIEALGQDEWLIDYIIKNKRSGKASEGLKGLGFDSARTGLYEYYIADPKKVRIIGKTGKEI